MPPRRALLSLAALAGGVFVATLVAVPLLDLGRDVLRSHPEHYADGPAGALVRAGYLAVAVMALALAGALAAEERWLARAAALSLAGGAASSFVLAAAPQEVTGGILLAGVLGLALAPLAVSLDGRKHLPRALAWSGVAVTAGFLALVMFAPNGVSGLTNRLWDVLLGGWGVASGLVLPEGTRLASAASPR